MIIGMTVVFSFLVIMVVVLNLVARMVAVLAKRFPEKVPGAQAPARDMEQDIAIALAAVSGYRATH